MKKDYLVIGLVLTFAVSMGWGVRNAMREAQDIAAADKARAEEFAKPVLKRDSRIGYLASVQRVSGPTSSYFVLAIVFDDGVHYYDVPVDKVITKFGDGQRTTVEIKDGMFIIFMPTTDKLI